ncbi:MAG: hypothetical protein WAZ27_02835 [Minisyncoccia bacterium]
MPKGQKSTDDKSSKEAGRRFKSGKVAKRRAEKENMARETERACQPSFQQR